MGGREGSRGYLYQAIASVLNSLYENDWEYVQLEPDSQNDKIDVMWEYKDGRKKVTQIKSSYNNLSQADIKNWLEELINDAEDSEELSLLLIGTCSDNTKRFINKINKLKSTDSVENEDLSTSIKARLTDISIQLENFDQAALETKINSALDKFVTEKGHILSYYTREMMVGAIIHIFFGFSTNGQKVSREAFENKVLKWVEFNSTEVKRNNLTKKKLAVYFYEKHRVDFSTSTEEINYNFSNISYIDNLKEKLSSLIKEVKEINLSVEDMEIANDEPLGFKFQGLGIKPKSLFQNYPKPNSRHAEISEEEKENYIVKTQDLLGESIQKDFFYVGDLRVVTSSRESVFSSTSYAGTDLEKKKGELINKFKQNLSRLETAINYFDYLSTLSLIPLVLRNEGEVFDEDIKVSLKFPKSVTVITEDNLKIPNNIDFIEFLSGPDGAFNQIMRHHKNSKVHEYIRSDRYSKKLILHPLEAIKLETYKKELRHYLKFLYNREIFPESDSTVVDYHFNKLNVSNSISFPSFIFVKAKDSFEIEYEVTSKNLNNLIKGKLFYKIKHT
ncbi:hypothetical protein [Priestia aryabhattai]